MNTRRQFVARIALATASAMVPAALVRLGASVHTRRHDASSIARGRGAVGSTLGEIATIERTVGGRLGVVALDARTGATLAHRADERFPMASTFKWLLAVQVLARVDRAEESLDRRLVYTAADVLPYAPVTSRRVQEGSLDIATLLTAAVTVSDNTAANLLLAEVGGPAGFTAFARTLGDTETRLDRNEPMLNEARPGDPRDTTTPRAMAGTLGRCLTGGVLSDASRARLLGWMTASTTGKARLRAGFPAGWLVADKTGTALEGTSNDVAYVQPMRTSVDASPVTDGSPLLVAAYLTGSADDAARRDAALGDVARVITDWRAR